MRKIAKRALAMLCVFSMLCSMLVTAQTSEIKLAAGSIVVEKGTGTETVDLPITISNNTGIIGMTLTINYGEGLTLMSVKKGDAFTALTMTKPGDFSANPVKVTWDGEGENDYGNGTAVTLSFTVSKDIEKEYPIEISVSGVIDENLSKVTMSTENGKITVGGQSHTHSFGNWTKVDDTNHSRKCECGETETGTHEWDDGIVITPATETTTGIRTYTCSVCNGTKTEIISELEGETTEGIKLTAGSIVVEKGTGTETVDLPITLSNNTGIIGMTLTVKYGEGLTLTSVKKGSAFTALTMTKPGDFSANPVKVTWDGEGENDYGNGTTVTLSFTVPKDIAKEYPIEISVSGVIDENLTKLTVTTVNGSITVKAAQQEEIQPEITGGCKVFAGPYVKAGGQTVPCGLVFAQAQTQFGNYTLKEYGVLFSEMNFSGNAFVIGAKGVFKAEGLKARNTGGQFGILFYGSNIQYGKTYYAIPYGIYAHEDGTEKTVYGEAVSFTPNE